MTEIPFTAALPARRGAVRSRRSLWLTVHLWLGLALGRIGLSWPLVFVTDVLCRLHKRGARGCVTLETARAA